jgi:hypothetical protein
MNHTWTFAEMSESFTSVDAKTGLGIPELKQTVGAQHEESCA